MAGVSHAALIASYGELLAKGIRLNGTDEYLSFTPGSTTTDRTQFTWDVWVRPGTTGINNYIHTVDAASFGGRLYINTSNQLVLFGHDAITPGNTHCLITSSVTFSADVWKHVHVEYDTGLAAASRVRFWFDGTEDASKTNTVNPSGTNTFFGLNAQPHYIGHDANASGFFDGDLALFHWVDGSVVGVTTFADTVNGVYKAIEATGLTYDNNGFHLDFTNSADLGNDADNGNDYTRVNVDSANQIGDGPRTTY